MGRSESIRSSEALDEEFERIFDAAQKKKTMLPTEDLCADSNYDLQDKGSSHRREWLFSRSVSGQSHEDAEAVLFTPWHCR